MPVTREYREYVLEQLGRIAPVTARSMFGGVGIYSAGLFFALMYGDLLYFKVNETNRPDFERAGKGPFRPFAEKSTTMQYYEVPGELLERPDELRPWVEKALAVALNKQRRK